MVRALGLVVVVVLALCMWFGWHVYLLDRLVTSPAWPDPWPLVLEVLVIAGALSFFLVPVAERLLRPPLTRVVAWPGSVWLGVAFVALVFVALSDVVLWALGGGDTHTLRWRAAGVVAITTVAVIIGMRSAFRPVVRRVDIGLRRWPSQLDGYRIVQITDIHIGPILGRDFARDLVDRVAALDPDLVAVTGDLVDGHVSRIRGEVAPFAELRARDGVYFVTGNHDHYSRADDWCSVAADLGMRVLRNRWERVERDEAAFVIAGVDDHRGGMLDGGGEDLHAALHEVPEHDAVVLLAHDPTTFKAASRHDIDLQISGHTHGGQIWPFRYLVRVVVPYVAGLYRRGKAQLYVSRGTGFWGPPMRLGAPSEITELVIRRARVG